MKLVGWLHREILYSLYRGDVNTLSVKLWYVIIIIIKWVQLKVIIIIIKMNSNKFITVVIIILVRYIIILLRSIIILVRYIIIDVYIFFNKMYFVCYFKGISY
jgi:hypothetical protein